MKQPQQEPEREPTREELENEFRLDDAGKFTKRPLERYFSATFFQVVPTEGKFAEMY